MTHRRTLLALVVAAALAAAASPAMAQFPLADLGSVVHPRSSIKTSEPAQHVVFAPGGGGIFAFSVGANLQVWDATGNAPRQLMTTATSVDRHTEPITSVAFRPDGRSVATAAADGTMKLWEPQSGSRIARNDALLGTAVRDLRFAPQDGSVTLVASVDGVLTTFDGTSLRKTRSLPVPDETVAPILYTADGATLVASSVASSGQRWVRFFEVSSGRETRKWGVARGADHCTANIDASLVACVAPANQATIHNGATGAIDAIITVPEPITDMQFSRNTGVLAIAARDHAIRIYDARSGQRTGTLLGHRDGPHGIAFSADGVLLASSGDDGVLVWVVPY